MNLLEYNKREKITFQIRGLLTCKFSFSKQLLQAISTDSWLSYIYAVGTEKPFPLGEPAIARAIVTLAF